MMASLLCLLVLSAATLHGEMVERAIRGLLHIAMVKIQSRWRPYLAVKQAPEVRQGQPQRSLSDESIESRRHLLS